MGIPRLTGQLEPYSVPLILGYQTVNFSKDLADSSSSLTPIIIDGPGLAYHIYHRLLAHRSACLKGLDAIPSYGEIGRAFIAYLDTLNSHIYFDGFLPLHKRPTRQARLELSLKDLVKTHDLSPAGFSIGAVSRHASSPSWIPGQLLNSPLPLPSSHRHLPAPAFLVPAVLDGLAESQYASIVDIVPAEADLHCALAALKLGGTILTSDSDLLVFDIGPEASVVLLNSLSISALDGDPEAGSLLKANVFKTAEIARTFQLPNLQRLGYEIKTDPTTSFSETLRRTQTPVADPVNFRAFIEEYTLPPSSSEAATPPPIESKPRFLDPRLSELILQLQSSPPPHQADEITVYLPLPLDDPTRSSAWTVSSCIRHRAYSLLASHLSARSPIAETSRRGHRILPTSIPASKNNDPDLKNLPSLLEKSQQRFPELQPSLRFRIFALAYIHRWCTDRGKTPPSRGSLLCALTGKTTRHLSWEAVHLDAQAQGVVYALRMLQQSLRHLGGVAAEDGLHDLAALLGDLPDLARGLLCPSRAELRAMVVAAGLDVTVAMDFILDPDSSAEEGGDAEFATNEGHETQEEADERKQDIPAEWQRPKKRKSGRSSKGTKAPQTSQATTPKTRNLYELLGS
ncbi:MAG: hypothetical protein LQ344_002760 [Seirophora lacunosa]|nr:MAG: hypothetical protein LQ344_002760 [Seirophora lacunosa]